MARGAHDPVVSAQFPQDRRLRCGRRDDTFYAIAHVPAGDGSGFQWLAVFPLGMIFGVFFLPVWLLVAIGKFPRFTTLFGVCGLIAFAYIWAQLLTEFPKG